MFLSFFTLPVRAWPRVAGDVAPRQWAWILVKDKSWRIWFEKDEIMKQEQAETKELLVWLRLQKGWLVPKQASWEPWMQQNASQGFHRDTGRSCARKEHFGSPSLPEWRWEEWKNCMHSHNSQLSQLSEVPSHYLLYDSFSFFSPSVQWPCIQSLHDPTPMPQTTQERRNNSNSNQTSLYCSEYIVRITQEHTRSMYRQSH